MRILLIALFAIVSSIALHAPAQARTLSYSEVETVCGTHATTGVDKYGRTYIYCMRPCGVDGEKVCYYRCVGLICEGWVFAQTIDPGTEPEQPTRPATHSTFDSLSDTGGSSGGGIGGGGGGGGGSGGRPLGDTTGSFATTASPGFGSGPSLL